MTADLFSPRLDVRAELAQARATLAPCAHCGGAGDLHPMPGSSVQWRARCRNAWCFATTSPRPSPTQAANVWNRRPDDGQPPGFYQPPQGDTTP